LSLAQERNGEPRGILFPASPVGSLKAKPDRTYLCDASILALSEAMRANVAPAEAAAASASAFDDQSAISVVGTMAALTLPRLPVTTVWQRRANSTRSAESTNIRRIL